MLQKGILNALLTRFDLHSIEQHLIYTFIEAKKLNYLKSPMLSSYFKEFRRDAELYMNTCSIGISDLKVLENYLELLIPKEDRKVNGAFFTPTYIVDFIVKHVQPERDDACLDPSCGCGAFLLGLVNYYQNTFKKSVKETVRDNIFGSDILAYNIHRAKLLLALLALQHDEILEETDFNLVAQDSLRTPWQQRFKSNPSGQFDRIVGNPPYVRFQDLSKQNRTFLYEYWKTVEQGAFNLYFAFFELGYNLLKPKGKLGYITPNNYFTSLAGESLRKYFHSTQCVTRIVDFSHRQVFGTHKTYTAITFLDKKANTSIMYDRIAQDQEPIVFTQNVKGSPNALKELKIKKWRLLKTAEKSNIKTIETIGIPLSKLVNIFVGIATLKDRLYFLHTRQKNGYFVKTIDSKTFKIEPEITRPVYKVSDFKNQEEIKHNTRHIIFPYKIVSGNAIALNKHEMRQNFPKCYKYFRYIKNRLDARGKGERAAVPFYAYGRSQGLTKTGKKIVTPTFSKRPRFLVVNDEQALFCNGYGIYFKNKQEESQLSWGELIHPLSRESNSHLLQKILNSHVMHYYVSTTSVSIEGGYACYQKNFIERFTVPDFSQQDLNTLNTLTIPEEIDAFLIEKYQLQLNLPVPNLRS